MVRECSFLGGHFSNVLAEEGDGGGTCCHGTIFIGGNPGGQKGLRSTQGMPCENDCVLVCAELLQTSNFYWCDIPSTA